MVKPENLCISCSQKSKADILFNCLHIPLVLYECVVDMLLTSLPSQHKLFSWLFSFAIHSLAEVMDICGEQNPYHLDRCSFSFTCTNGMNQYHQCRDTCCYMPVLWHCYGSSVTVLWQFSDSVMAVQWQCYGSSVTVLWQFSDSVMEVQWHCYGSSVTLLWQFSDTVMAVQWHCYGSSVTLLWQISNTVVTVLWQYSDSVMAVQWQYYDSAMRDVACTSTYV